MQVSKPETSAWKSKERPDCNGLLEDPKARDLLFLIEESFVSHLPKQAAYGNLVVLRRL